MNRAEALAYAQQCVIDEVERLTTMDWGERGMSALLAWSSAALALQRAETRNYYREILDEMNRRERG